METYKFYVDRKITTWVRETHYLDAESKQQAVDIMSESLTDNMCNESNTFCEREIMYDTEDCMTVKENGDNPTIELYMDDNNELKFIADNINDV